MTTDSSNVPSSSALVAFPFTNAQSQPSASSLEPQLTPDRWQPILRASNQVVLYNPRSHALSVTSSASGPGPGIVVARRQHPEGSRVIGDTCPYCKQSLPAGFRHFDTAEESVGVGEDDTETSGDRWEDFDQEDDFVGEVEHLSTDPAYHSRASDYFRLLAIANETSSAAGSRRPSVSPSRYRVQTSETSWSRSRSGSRRNGRSRSASRTEDSVRVHRGDDNRSRQGTFPSEKMAEGYFKMFFREEYKLGMGANGSVYLCQHLLDGNPLGHFAVKKIAVGESHSYLLKILKEVRLLERLHHPNIISYHHAWLETAQFSSFGPKVPTLHVLMQWAEGGSLDDFIDVRLGRKSAHAHMHPVLSSSSTFDMSVPASPAYSTEELPGDANEEEPTTPVQMQAQPKTPKHPRFGNAESSPGTQPRQQHAESNHDDPHSRSARIRAFRAFQRAPPEEKDRMRRDMENTFGTAYPPAGAPGSTAGPSGAGRKEWTAVHLLSAQEVKSLFHDVTQGLAFLHRKSILHLDLKPGNVLLTWDEGRLIPRAMLSDFGTSRDMINSTRMQRSGNTGTLEYAAPESLPSPQTGLLQQIDSKADMWSLGMILHKLLFFKLPYRYAAEGDANGEPISRDDEGEKMMRLESEVLDYPGFKSTSTLVVGFEARRLSRAYLVLLEKLLHRSPVERPNCERVNAAIMEGKLDPLAETASENLSLARPRGDPSAPPSSIDNPREAAREASGLEGENRRILALPSSVAVLGPEEGSWRRQLSWTNWARFVNACVVGNSSGSLMRSGYTKGWIVVGMKALRSCLLIVKVATIPRACSEPMTYPRRWLVGFLMVVALLDMVIDHEDGFEPRERSRREKEYPQYKRQRSPSKWRQRLFANRNSRNLWITLGLAVFHFVFLSLSSSWSSGYSMGLGSWGRSACCVVQGADHGVSW